MKTYLKILNGSFLVAGTSIGGGMLALPVLCAKVGLLPSLLVMLGVWAFMTTTALLYLECSTWMKQDSHLVSMASKLLGSWGKKVCWIVFVFLCYTSLVAYLSGGGRMVHEFLSNSFAIELPHNSAYFIYAAVFAGLLFFGTHIVGTINSIMFILLIASFVFMIHGAWDLDHSLLLRQDWKITGLVALVPMMLTTFSFPGIVPVLVSYHHGNTSKVRSSILSGTLLTMTIYAIWLFAVLGNVPWEGPHGLADAFASDKHACDSLVHFLESPMISILAQGFAFLALSTSFIGIASGLKHFLSEGFNIKGTDLMGNLVLFLMITIPVLAIKFQFEKVFFHALDVTGGIGDGVLSGFIPALMVWRGRYTKGLIGNYRFFGNKIILFSIFCFSFAVITYEVTKILSSFLLA